MRKKILDLSDTSDKVGDHLSADQLGSLNPKLGVNGEGLDKLAARLNTELDQLVRKLVWLKVIREAKKRNPHTDYQKDIEATAKDLAELIRKAPPPVSTYPKFVDLADQLERIFEWFSEIEDDPALSGFDLESTYEGKRADMRHQFVRDAHDLYAFLTPNEDWITLSHGKEKRYSNLFFRLIRLCYSCAKIPVGDSTIARDIPAARKLSAIAILPNQDS